VDAKAVVFQRMLAVAEERILVELVLELAIVARRCEELL